MSTTEDDGSIVEPSIECVFCDIVAHREHAGLIAEGEQAVAFVPLNPVVKGHVLVIPVFHVEDALQSDFVTGLTMGHAVRLANELGYESCNFITSVGAPATQTVKHLHIHVVPRYEDDGLILPWTNQETDVQEG